MAQERILSARAGKLSANTMVCELEVSNHSAENLHQSEAETVLSFLLILGLMPTVLQRLIS